MNAAENPMLWMRRADLDAMWDDAIEAQDFDALGRLILGDFEGCCRYLFWIKDRGGKDVRPVFNRCQRVAWAHIRRQLRAGVPVRQVWLKFRQWGASTKVSLFMAWRTGFHAESSLVALHRETPGRSVFAKVETVFAKLPAGLVPRVANRDVGTLLRFDHPLDSVIRRDSAENIEIGVGETFQNYQLSEVARYKDAEATLADLLPAIPDFPNTSAIMESTGKGAGDYFNEKYDAAEAGEDGWEAVFFPWYWHEEYVKEIGPDDQPFSVDDEAYREWIRVVGVAYPLDDEGEFLEPGPAPGVELTDAQLNWRRWKLREFRGNVDKFREQFPGTASEAWVAGSGLVVGPGVQDRVEMDVREPHQRGEWVVRVEEGRRVRRFVPRRDGAFWMWELPRPDGYYIVSADTSSGAAKDHSTLIVWDCNQQPGKMVQVAEWSGLMKPTVFKRLVWAVAFAYSSVVVRDGRVVRVPAYLAIERNTHGETVIDGLRGMGFPENRIYRHVQGGTRDAKESDKFGWPTSWVSKVPMVERFEEALSDGSMVVRSKRLLGEVRSFVWGEGQNSAAAVRGKRDDLVMAAAVGRSVWLLHPKRRMRRVVVAVPAQREAGAGLAGMERSSRNTNGELLSSVTGY